VFASTPIFLKDEIRIYYGGNNGHFFDCRDGFLCLATLHPDDFAGYEPITQNESVYITALPLICSKGSLTISADVQKDGFINVKVLNKRNKVLAISKSISQTATETKIEWQNGWSLEQLKERKLLPKFELRKAKLFAFSFIQ